MVTPPRYLGCDESDDPDLEYPGSLVTGAPEEVECAVSNCNEEEENVLQHRFSETGEPCPYLVIS